MSKIKLGVKAKDVVTGFEGIVTAKVEYLNGCVQYALKPKIDPKAKEKMPEGIYIDAQQLEYVNEGVNIKSKAIGGPQQDCPAA